MKRIVIAIGASLLAASAWGAEKTEAAKIDGALYIRSDFGTNRFLIRKIDLSGSDGGNNVVNFAGARIVSNEGDVPFNRGYVVSREKDDISPVKFNGTFMGANHGAFFGVKIPTTEAISVGTAWKDGSGANFRVVSAEKESVTMISDSVGTNGEWKFKLSADGDLHEVGGGRTLSSAGQARAQIYPSVRRVSMSVSSGFFSPLNDKFRKVSSVKIGETYEVLSPLPGNKAVARISVQYVLQGNETKVQTTVKALDQLNGFSMVGTQAGPLNYQNAQLLQRVDGSDSLNQWTDISKISEAFREKSQNLVASQKVGWGTYKYGQTIRVDRVTINGKPVERSRRIDISAARKQYPIAVDGLTLQPGDVVKVNAHRQYWAGDEPPTQL